MEAQIDKLQKQLADVQERIKAAEDAKEGNEEPGEEEDHDEEVCSIPLCYCSTLNLDDSCAAFAPCLRPLQHTAKANVAIRWCIHAISLRTQDEEATY